MHRSVGANGRTSAQAGPAAACVLLTELAAAGIDHLFANAGTDFAPLIAAYAAARESAALPRPVAVAHEAAAVAAAHGAYLAGGTVQAVMVHVSVGLANALSQVMNAHREDVPLLVMAGRTPFTEAGHPASRDVAIHWGQELFDQAAFVREVTRWQGQLTRAGQIRDLLRRALAVAQGPDPGPVYLELPREPLADPVPEAGLPPAERASARLGAAEPDPRAVTEVIARLVAAERPLVITQRAGRDPAAFALLSRFAEKAAVPIVEYRPNYANLPDDHPLHAGFSPPMDLHRRDMILLLDCPVPWLPVRHGAPADAFVADVAPDPLARRWPLRSFPADLRIAAGAGAFLASACDRLAALDRAARARLDARRRKLETALADGRSQVSEAADRPESGLDAAAATRILAAALPADAVVFNELGALRPHLTVRRPGGFFGPPNAGALGWAYPAALGYKLAAREAFVVATVGDGSAIFANPVACHQLAMAEGLAVLVVVFNNRRWESVRWAAESLYPELARESALPLVALEPSPDFAAVARGCGLAAWQAGDGPTLKNALVRAMQVVARGRPACVEIAIA